MIAAAAIVSSGVLSETSFAIVNLTSPPVISYNSKVINIGPIVPAISTWYGCLFLRKICTISNVLLAKCNFNLQYF